MGFLDNVLIISTNFYILYQNLCEYAIPKIPNEVIKLAKDVMRTQPALLEEIRKKCITCIMALAKKPGHFA